jgi:branched-chain amino acid transport system substrate-binding protein
LIQLFSEIGDSNETGEDQLKDTASISGLLQKTAAGLSLGLALLAMSAPASAADDIVVGFAVAKSGPFQVYDADGANMGLLFIDQQNAKGGLLGRQLKAVVVDTKSDRAEGAKAGQAVIQQGASLVVVTGDYDFGAPAALAAEKAGVVSMFLSAEGPLAGIPGVGPHSFTASAAAPIQGATMAEWGYKKKGYRNAFVLLDDAIDYSKSVCDGFNWAFERLGGKIVGHDTFKNGDPSIASQVTRISQAIRDQKADSIMLCTFMPGGATAVRQIRAAGIDLPILSDSAADGDYWLNAAPGLKDFYAAIQASVGEDPRPEVRDLTAAYNAKFNAVPATMYGYPIYAGLQLWAKAVTQAGATDAAAVVAKMEQFKDEPTVLGPRSFSNALHVQMRIPMQIEEAANQKFKVVDEWTLEEPVPTIVFFGQK